MISVEEQQLASQACAQTQMNQAQEALLIDERELADLAYIEVSKRGYRALKRTADVVLSAMGLAVLAVPMAVIAAAIYIDDPGKILFRQKRIGLEGKTFRFYKFRTMKESTPRYLATAEVEHPEQYITRLGGFLRRSSLDELPQLINVFKGDMSLVGPRPLIAKEEDIHRMRLRFGVYNVRPGITGLAQINGRDTVLPAQKVRWDVKYLETFGLMTDLKILLSTLPKAIAGSGVVEGGGEENEIIR